MGLSSDASANEVHKLVDRVFSFNLSYHHLISLQMELSVDTGRQALVVYLRISLSASLSVYGSSCGPTVTLSGQTANTFILRALAQRLSFLCYKSICVFQRVAHMVN